MTVADPRREELFNLCYNDRWFAHEFLFEHRHGDKSPDFHETMVRDWHAHYPKLLDIVFRGAAKSSRAEEAIPIMAGFKEFRYALIVGNTFDRAAQRLHAIRYEIENNERLEAVFGPLQGQIWSADQLLLSNGVMIQAIGKGASMRGVKHLDQRPDLFFGDDLEEWEDVRTEKARGESLRWFHSDLLPALDPRAKIRIAGTLLHPQSLLAQLRYTGEYKTKKIPWYSIGEGGAKVPAWPERFSLEKIEKVEDTAQRLGQMRAYRAEYMCQAEAPEDKPFKREMFRIEPRVRTWQPVYAMFDPARTTNKTSSLTGYAAWSWLGPRLVVWDSWGKPLMPDEIIDEIFQCNDYFHPVTIGVEEDGLHQFLMQPIRQEQLKRRVTIPVRPMKAPNGKLDFIRGLQPFFSAREVEFAQSQPDLESALLSFPSGKIDAPNALAYALTLRPGLQVYIEFGERHVAEDLRPTINDAAWLALNATRSMTTGVLVQIIDGAMRVFADWIVEGEPADALGRMVEAANLEAGQAVRLVASSAHFDRYTGVGLPHAARALGADLRQSISPEGGRAWLRDMLGREIRHVPAVMVSTRARWTLNGLSGGYCHGITKQGLPTPYAEEGRYRTLMEGLEAFCGLTQARSTDADAYATNAVTPGGQAYRSAMPQRR